MALLNPLICADAGARLAKCFAAAASLGADSPNQSRLLGGDYSERICSSHDACSVDNDG